MKRVLFLLTFLITFAQADEFTKDIETYLHMTNSLSSVQMLTPQLTQSMRQINPSIPQDFLDELVNEMTTRSLLDLMVPIYKKHFTHKDIQALIAFYNSPIGKKLAEKTPLITQESMVAGQQWGAGLAMEIMKKLKSKGYDMGI